MFIIFIFSVCELSFISGTLWEHLCFRKAAGFVTFLLAYARIIHFKWLCNRLLKSWGLAPQRFIFFAHSSFPLFPLRFPFLAAVLHFYRAHTRLSLFFLLLDIFKSKILSPNNPEICAAMQWVWEAALLCSALLWFCIVVKSSDCAIVLPERGGGGGGGEEGDSEGINHHLSSKSPVGRVHWAI